MSLQILLGAARNSSATKDPPLPKPKPISKQDINDTNMMTALHDRSSPMKPRSLSDAPKPSLSPSPAIREAGRIGVDDTIFASPSTPKRPNLGIRGLSLQMPRDAGSPGSLASRVPLSPKLDMTQTHGTPAAVLPRRSRGLDFARACTNLHHSTLAESSPDSSPTISGRGMNIPHRRVLGSAIVDSPSHLTHGAWPPIPPSDRTLPPSSYGSIGMVDDSDDSDSSSDEDMYNKDGEYSVFTTPHVSKISTNFISGPANSPGGDWMTNRLTSTGGRPLSFPKARLRRGHSGPSSSSGNSSKPSPAPSSPPLMKSVETNGPNYFQQGLTHAEVQSRRESLSLGTGDLHLWDSADEDTKPPETKEPSGTNTATSSTTQSPRGVIRRPVTRRSNLLPKTKTFARIRATLIEESAPVENEARREADVIHQVRESDPTVPSPRRSYSLPLQIQMPVPDHPIPPLPSTFGQHAEKNSQGARFWDTFEPRNSTPPPLQLKPRLSSSAMSLDTNPGIGIFTARQQTDSCSNSRASTPLAPGAPAPTAGEAARNANNRKRGRDDDLDPQSLKRRAVSPGMSVHSSPVLPQSPGLGTDKGWGGQVGGVREVRERAKTNTGERSNSGGSSKRVGLQGMTDTNDGLMNMSIE